MEDSHIAEELHKLLPRKDLWEFIIKKPYKEGKQLLTKEQCLLYIVGMYSNHSPYKDTQDIIEKKVNVVKVLNFSANDEIIDITCGKNAVFNQYILSYLKLYRQPKYTLLKLYNDQRYAEIANLQNVDNSSTLDEKGKADAKAKIKKNIDDFSNEIEKLTEEFLAEDNTRGLIQDLWQDVLTEDAMFPEEIAYNIKNGLSPLGTFNPYE